MRRRLTRRIAASTAPYAWTTAELIIPKRGQHSVGVHRHVVAGADRPVNCQRSLGFFLATDAGSFPVDWSLVLRAGWESDSRRRDRARIPATESGHPAGAYVMDFADSVAAEPRLPDIPWFLDLTHCEDAVGVLAGLVRRTVDFTCEVDAGQPVLTGPEGSLSVVTVGELMEIRLGQPTHVLARQGDDDQCSAVAIYARQAGVPLFDASTKGRTRSVRVLKWPAPSGRLPNRYWITSRIGGHVGEALALTRARTATLATLAELQERFGALDFEGRSFPGWHHHMTVASAAYAYRHLSGGPPTAGARPGALAGSAS